MGFLPIVRHGASGGVYGKNVPQLLLPVLMWVFSQQLKFRRLSTSFWISLRGVDLCVGGKAILSTSFLRFDCLLKEH